MIDIIVILIIAVILSSAAYYIYKEKKNGNKCIGCPYGKQCNGNCSTQTDDETDKL